MTEASVTIVHCAEDALAAYASQTLVDRIVRERARADWLRENWSGELLAAARRFVDFELREGWSGPAGIKNLREREPLRRLRIHPSGLVANAAVAYLCARLAQALALDEPWVLLLSFDVGEPLET